MVSFIDVGGKMSTQQSLQKLAPRHVEMMNRLLIGQKGSQIAREMDVTQARLSLIIHSPLFQLELRRRQAQQAERLVEIREDFLSAAQLGVKHHKEVLSEQTNPLNAATKMKAATTMTILATKLIQSPPPTNGSEEMEEGQSYEERLRKVTYEETVRKVQGQSPPPEKEEVVEGELIDVDRLLSESYPPEDVLQNDEDDALFKNAPEEDPFYLPLSEDHLLPTVRKQS